MPPKGKHKNASNQHDKSTGLAAPGKRVSKDKPGQPINGHVNGKAVQSAPPPPLPTTGLNQGLTFPRPANTTAELVTSSEQEQTESSEGGEKEKESLQAHGAGREEVTNDMAPAAGVGNTSSEPKCVSDSNALKNLTSQASSTLALAATILTSCPLRDAIAILILFLSLPPTLIITVHTLFASLTFVPPAAGFVWSSWTSFPSVGDWFHATPGGGPSPFTILMFDFFMTLVYTLCPLYLQNVVMDLAQAVIAISLSGATVGKGGSTNSVAVCSIIICMSHILGYKALHITAMNYVRSALHELGLNVALPPTATDSFSPRAPMTHGWPRALLGCHILAQGILTLLRRWVAGASQPRSSKKQDPEAAPATEASKLASNSLDPNSDVNTNSSTDGRPPGPSPAVRDSKERVSNSKKKRKQANQVRSQQPLWAAIASTKVTFLKEMEQKQASHDAIEAGVTDTTKSGFANTLLPDDRVWILEIRSTDITFKAEMAVARLKDDASSTDDSFNASSSIDKIKPFFVRLNGADWSSARIVGAADSEIADVQEHSVWHGEIFGLTPLTKYSCEFVRLSDQQVVSSTSLITLSAPSTEQASSVPAPPQHQSLRPLSPTSTLKQSIAAAENKREEIRNKLKRTRKDHKTAASAVRKEIEQLNAKVASSGGHDERQKQRILQLKQNVKQTEDAALSLKADLDALGEVPAAELEEAALRKRAWDAALEAKAAAAAELETAKAEANNQMSQLHAEFATSVQKRERLITRRTKLSEQYERLLNEQTANLSARQRHEQERARSMQERAELEAKLLYWTSQSRQHEEDLTIKANEYYQQADYESRQLARQHGSPTTPEGDLPGTNGTQHRVGNGFDYQMFGMPQNPAMNRQSWAGGARQRSSSMLSDVSGFTDDLNMGPQGIEPEQERKRSNGSSGSGSVGDQMSPRFAVRPPMSPIGPPSAEERIKGKARQSPIGSNR